MKYPTINSMPIEAIIIMAEKSEDKKFKEYANQLGISYYIEINAPQILLKKYKLAHGFKRKIIGEAIALKLLKGQLLIDNITSKILIEELSLEYLWPLSINCPIEEIKRMAHEKIISKIAEFEDDEELKEKIKTDEQYLLNRVKPN